MCTRPTPSYRSVDASAGALVVSALNTFHALAVLLVALATTPIRHFPRRLRRGRSATLAGMDVQIHLGDQACVVELESIV